MRPSLRCTASSRPDGSARLRRPPAALPDGRRDAHGGGCDPRARWGAVASLCCREWSSPTQPSRPCGGKAVILLDALAKSTTSMQGPWLRGQRTVGMQRLDEGGAVSRPLQGEINYSSGALSWMSRSPSPGTTHPLDRAGGVSTVGPCSLWSGCGALRGWEPGVDGCFALAVR